MLRNILRRKYDVKKHFASEIVSEETFKSEIQFKKHFAPEILSRKHLFSKI